MIQAINSTYGISFGLGCSVAASSPGHAARAFVSFPRCFRPVLTMVVIAAALYMNLDASSEVSQWVS